MDDPKMQTFYDVYNLKSLIKQPTCYKNSDKPSCNVYNWQMFQACSKVNVW